MSTRQSNNLASVEISSSRRRRGLSTNRAVEIPDTVPFSDIVSERYHRTAPGQ